MTQVSTSIAIVGCGPKGLYALDSLCQAVRGVPARQFDVHIFEPACFPGAGPIYDPAQPDVLLMNFPAYMIDAWTGGRGPSLLSWLKSAGVPYTAGAYVPRAWVGRYLNDCFDRVLETAPDNMRITLHPKTVTTLRQVTGAWQVSPGAVLVDEVLVTTGHQDWTRRTQASRTGTIASPFPIADALTSAAVPSGCAVSCKGFALTFLDTVLALTEGRGGVFCMAEQSYSYRPSGSEPALIAPFSRSGRPMRAKVDTDRFLPPQGHRLVQEHSRAFETTLAEATDVTFRDTIWPALLRIADAMLQQPEGMAADGFASWREQVFTAKRCRAEMLLGYEIAKGVAAPDSLWALGEIWRRCYPTIVGWISHRDLAADDAAFFREIAVEMERLAFGPPAQNIGKLLCLESIGLVSFDHLAGDLRSDVLIDATIPAAGCAALSVPFAGLLGSGHVSVGALGGLCVDTQAQALTDRGVTRGLSIIGRVTEGCVLGNDTLSRQLHDLPERWAARVTCPAPVPVWDHGELSA